MTLTPEDRAVVLDIVQRELRGADVNALVRQLQALGGAAFDDSTATYSTSATSFGDIDPGMPRVDLAAGTYLLLFGFQGGGSGGIAAPDGCGIVAADALSAVAADTAAGQNSSVARGTVRALTDGALVLFARSTGAGSASFARPWLAALRTAA